MPQAQPFEFVRDEDGSLTLSGAVHQALGAASMCWSETPSGIFDSVRALDVGTALIQFIRQEEGQGSKGLDAAEAMNRIARVVEQMMGEPVDGAPARGPWLPLSVRFGAAQAAARVVIAWREKGVTPGMDWEGERA